MFKKAVREIKKLKIAIEGPSGSGKTLGALRLAKGLVGDDDGNIAFIDTENDSGTLYANIVNFHHAQMRPPFNPERFVKAIDYAIEQGFKCLIIDSLSHAWNGEGGILDMKEKLDARGGNSFTNWGQLTPIQNKLVDKIINCQIHLICCMRTKTEYVIE